MKALLINGPQRASGSLTLSGNKNAALPMIAASMLTDETVVLHNVPDILDVRNMLAIVAEMGGQCDFENGTLTICAGKCTSTEPSAKLCKAVRTSVLFGGPLAVRHGACLIHSPGGDVIGRRRLDTHFYGLRKLGLVVTPVPGGCRFERRGKLKGLELFLDEASVTATEHILTVAVFAQGRTIIRNAACEPHVSQLAQLLNAMGARISGIETNILTIDGVEKLHGAEFTIGADHVGAASFLALAAATGGEVELLGNIMPHDYWMTRRVFARFGASFTVEPGRIYLNQNQPMRVDNDSDGVMPTISDGPWPQFPSDMMSCLIAMATQCHGAMLFFEKMFESRIYFVDRLIAMGANAVICDPHRAVISGPSPLHGAELISPDIRAGMALIIAACCARGTSLIRNADMVYRGYENLPGNLRALGIAVEEQTM
jgi:UDP-N-acetylglucosamine 1-carboxyvinyltransferase